MKSMVIVALMSLPAFADGAKEAFERARAAEKAGKIHEACAAYEESDKLEPHPETELNLASCYAKDGRPVSAAKQYRRAGKPEQAAKLEAKAAKLRLLPSQKPDGLMITVDGEPAQPGDVFVDAGPHEIVATAPGFAGHAHADIDRDKQTVDVILRLEAVAAPPPAVAAEKPAPIVESRPNPDRVTMPPPPPVDEHPSHRTRNGVIVGAVGVAALATGVVFFAASSGKFDDEHKLCPGSACGSDADLAKAKSLLDDGHLYRGLGYGLGIGGLALIGAGAYLMMTGHESHVDVAVVPGGASVGFRASF